MSSFKVHSIWQWFQFHNLINQYEDLISFEIGCTVRKFLKFVIYFQEGFPNGNPFNFLLQIFMELVQILYGIPSGVFKWQGKREACRKKYREICWWAGVEGVESWKEKRRNKPHPCCRPFNNLLRAWFE